MGSSRGIGRRFGALVSASNLLAALGIVALMVLVVCDVALRFFLNSPIPGVNEVMEISIVAMLYLQVTQALRDERHTRSTAFLGLLMARRPRVGHLLNAVFALAGLALMIAILAGALPRLAEAYSRDYTVGTRGIFLAPEWPIDLVIVYGCVLMAIQFAIHAVSRFADARRAASRGEAGGARPGAGAA